MPAGNEQLSHAVRAEAECRVVRGPPSSSGNAFHERESHVLRRLPMPLPLVDEPVVDLPRVEPRRLRQRQLLRFLERMAPLALLLKLQPRYVTISMHACVNSKYVRSQARTDG